MISSTFIVAASNRAVYAVTEQDIFSSTNNGVSWTSILGDFPTGYQQRRITSLQIDPNNSQTLYVGTWYGGAYKTTNGGQHWANMNTGLPAFTQIDDFAIDPTNISTIYAASYGWFNGNANESGIFKSIDGGGSWNPVSAGLTNRYIHSIVIHPTVGNIVYAGADGNGVFRSTSGGSLWQQVVQGLKNVDIKALLRVTDTIYAATALDGVYRSTNDGTSWEQINNGLPPTTQFGHTLAADEQGNVYFSVYKWGLLRLNSNTWVTVTNSLTQTEIRAIAAVSGTLMIGTASPDKPDDMGILISTDLGNTWTPQNTGLPTTTFQIRALSVQQIGYSVTMFAATSEGIYRTALSPISWIPSNSGLTTKDIYAVTVDPNNPNVLYAATWCAYVFKSEDGGGTWGQSTNGLNTSCSLSTIVNPVNSNQVYVGMDNGVYQSNDGGSFWSKLGADSLNDSTKDLEILPDQTLLAATTSGVWKTQISAPITPTITPTPSVSQTWTVMVYLNGDNNLERYMAEAFNRLELAASNPNVKIFALWDGPDKGDTREYLVQPHGHSYVEGVNYWNWGELDMGDPNTLIDFVNRSRARQPADHYFLAIVDHGGGWSPELYLTQALGRWAFGGSGFSWDDTNDFHYLSSKDMKTVFNQITAAGGPIDVVYYDACLMAMLEEAYQIRNGAIYLVASENETWTSFPYDTYLNSIDSTTSPRELAVSIVDNYYDSLLGYPRTMSAIDLSQVEPVSTLVDGLSQALIGSLPTSKEVISQAFRSAQKMDYNFDFKIEDTEGYVDLASFATELANRMPGTTVATAANKLLNKLNDPQTPLVIHERHQSNIAWPTNEYLDLNRSTGLSIYLPIGKLDFDLSFYLPIQIDLAADTHWDDFVFAFIGYFPQSGTLPYRGNHPGPGDLKPKVFIPLVLKH